MHPLANKEIAPLHLQTHCKSRSCQPNQKQEVLSVDGYGNVSYFFIGIAHNDRASNQRLTFPCITFWAQIESGDANTFLPDISDPRTHVHSLVDAVNAPSVLLLLLVRRALSVKCLMRSTRICSPELRKSSMFCCEMIPAVRTSP